MIPVRACSAPSSSSLPTLERGRRVNGRRGPIACDGPQAARDAVAATRTIGREEDDPAAPSDPIEPA